MCLSFLKSPGPTGIFIQWYYPPLSFLLKLNPSPLILSLYNRWSKNLTIFDVSSLTSLQYGRVSLVLKTSPFVQSYFLIWFLFRPCCRSYSFPGAQLYTSQCWTSWDSYQLISLKLIDSCIHCRGILDLHLLLTLSPSKNVIQPFSGFFNFQNNFWS